MRHRWPSVLFLAGQACTTPSPVETRPAAPAVSPELRSAREALAEALTERDPERVGRAARVASTWEGQDPSLDVLLGDALANVLMQPNEGIPLLRAHADPSDPTWATALQSAVLRTGNAAALEAALRETGNPPEQVAENLVAWMATRALRDPLLSIADYQAAAEACALFDAHPTRGRRPVDQPAPAGFFEALPRMGATLVVVGRAEVPPDPPADSGKGLQPCRTGRLWPGAQWPEPLSRHVTVGIATDTYPLFLSVRPESGEPWVFASTRFDVAGELVAQVRDLTEGAVIAPDWLPTRMAQARPTVARPSAD